MVVHVFTVEFPMARNLTQIQIQQSYVCNFFSSLILAEPDWFFWCEKNRMFNDYKMHTHQLRVVGVVWYSVWTVTDVAISLSSPRCLLCALNYLIQSFKITHFKCDSNARNNPFFTVFVEMLLRFVDRVIIFYFDLQDVNVVDNVIILINPAHICS